MPTPLKSALANTLSPQAIYWLRSVKRAIMSERPLPWPYGPDSAIGTTIQSAAPGDGRTIQDIALEKYKTRQLPSPASYFGYEDILILPAKEIARALTLCVQYI